MLLSHRTTGVCLRLLAIDDGGAGSLIEAVADLAMGVSVSSGDAGWLRGDGRVASNDERDIEKSDWRLGFTCERVPDELAMPSTVESETKIYGSQTHHVHVPTATQPFFRTSSRARRS